MSIRSLLAAAIFVLLLTATLSAGEIHDAVRSGNAAAVKELLNKDRSLLGTKADDGSTPLNLAALAANVEMAKLLLDMGADMNAGDNENSNALHCAAIGNSREIADMLLARGMDINVRDANGVTALIFAVGRGHADMTRYLLSKGANPDVESNAGMIALFTALQRGRNDIVRILLDGGANAAIKEQGGSTALMAAAYAGDPDIARLLIEKGADPNAGYDTGMAPLHAAAFLGKTEFAKVLLDHGAAVDPREQDGGTPLLNAVSMGRFGMTELLVQRGADMRITDKHTGASLLHVAAARGYGDVAELLLTRGTDVNASDGAGKTPLFYAAKYGNDAVAKQLEAKGAKADGIKQVKSRMARLGDKVGAGEARVHYLGHAGWAVETKDNLLIFDYFPNGRRSDDARLVNGCINPAEINGKKVTVFVSHKHNDHFDRSILRWLGKIDNITYVFGEKPDTTFAYELMGPREDRVINGVAVSTIQSTDAGVAFLVKADGVTLFHAGDDANKNLDLSGPFTPEIDYLAGKGESIDFAFIPVCGCGFPELDCVRKGIYYSVDKLHPKVLFPMHSSRAEYRYTEFAQDAAKNGCKAKIFCAQSSGDRYLYRKGKMEEI